MKWDDPSERKAALELAWPAFRKLYPQRTRSGYHSFRGDYRKGKRRAIDEEQPNTPIVLTLAIKANCTHPSLSAGMGLLNWPSKSSPRRSCWPALAMGPVGAGCSAIRNCAT